MKRLFFPIFFFLCSFSVCAQPWIFQDENAEPDTVTFFFFGDVMQHAPQISGARHKERQDYEYTSCFRYITPYWQQADYVVANLETTLSDKNYSGYPQFCAPWQLARDLKACGVNFLTTNNNHSCDKGASGIRKTLYYLDSLAIAHTGTFLDTTAWITRIPVYLRHGRFKIALLSYTYGTNGIPATHGQVVSLIDTFMMARHLEKARLDSVTNVIAIMHWGEEYFTHPNAEQKKLSAWLHENGADMVIGSHPHVVQPIEYITTGNDTTGITVYSLGNFVSNQSKRYTDGGLGIHLTLIRKQGKTRYRMQALSSYVYRPVEENIRRYYVIPEPEANKVVQGSDTLLYRRFFQDTDSILQGVAGKYSLPD